MHLRLRQALRKAGFLAMVSDRAFIRRGPPDKLTYQLGTNPHRIDFICRVPSSDVTVWISFVGHTLKFGDCGRSFDGVALNNSVIASCGIDIAKRPHIDCSISIYLKS